ncbi:hypothetical protein [uncultured Bacteroides sp.]|jgi:hypothetical protein|uniref:hypothetical protein n=1 Tax=uncultured Bacteroides sp. TaxID=162156 RepID=UPI00280BF732|nr:hypothetical protein [uncultured Bacteroides sp.]
MKLLKLLFVVLLFSCNNDSTETLETGEPKQIIVEMENPDATDIIDVSGTYNLEKNKEYCVREDGKYKIFLAKDYYTDEKEKEQEILFYSIFDVAKQAPVYFTEKIDVAKRLEREWEYYDKKNTPANTDKKLVCTSRIKEEE